MRPQTERTLTRRRSDGSVACEVARLGQKSCPLMSGARVLARPLRPAGRSAKTSPSTPPSNVRTVETEAVTTGDTVTINGDMEGVMVEHDRIDKVIAELSEDELRAARERAVRRVDLLDALI